MNPSLYIRSELPTGAPGEDADDWNPLARAVRALLVDGTRIRAVAQVYLATGTTQIARWIGMVVEGTSGRLMFFPGLPGPPDRMRHARAEHSPVDVAFYVDHLTLESNRESWHATEVSQSGVRHQGGPRTWDLGAGRVLWFGMTFAKDDALRPVKQTTSTTVAAPPNRGESLRRLEAFQRAVAMAQLAVIAPPGPPPFPRSLCHVAMVVGPPSAPEYDGPERGFGGDAAGMITTFPVPDDTQRRTHYSFANLSEQVRLQLMCTWFAGEMPSSAPVVFQGRAP